MWEQIRIVASVSVVTLLGAHTAVAAEEFPLRKQYDKVVPILTEDLSKRFGQAVIVDSRNQAEYDVIHIAGARLLLVGKMSEEVLAGIRPKDDPRPLVFYCNGVTCTKSYKAAEKAQSWGFNAVFCYDAGIFAWAKARPDRTEYFGKVLKREALESVLAVAADEYKRSQVSSADLLARHKAGGFTLIDIRDPNERSEVPFQLAGVKSISLDTVVDLIRSKSDTIPKKRLLIVDNVGKQGQWLHYYLKQGGFTEFYFLRGGVAQWKQDGYDAKGVRN